MKIGRERPHLDELSQHKKMDRCTTTGIERKTVTVKLICEWDRRNQEQKKSKLPRPAEWETETINRERWPLKEFLVNGGYVFIYIAFTTELLQIF
jgi:hypothetical protein